MRLGVWVGSGVAVAVAVSVGTGVAVSVGSGEIVTVGGNDVFVTASVGGVVDESFKLQPANMRARAANPIRIRKHRHLQRVIMGAIIPLW